MEPQQERSVGVGYDDLLTFERRGYRLFDANAVYLPAA